MYFGGSKAGYWTTGTKRQASGTSCGAYQSELIEFTDITESATPRINDDFDYHNVSWGDVNYWDEVTGDKTVITYSQENINDSNVEDEAEFVFDRSIETSQSLSVTQTESESLEMKLGVEVWGMSSEFTKSYEISTATESTESETITYDVSIAQTLGIAAKACTVFTLKIKEATIQKAWGATAYVNGMWFYNPYSTNGEGTQVYYKFNGRDDFYGSVNDYTEQKMFYGAHEDMTIGNVKGYISGSNGFSTSLTKTEYEIGYDSNGVAFCDTSARKSEDVTVPIPRGQRIHPTTHLAPLSTDPFRDVGKAQTNLRR